MRWIVIRESDHYAYWFDHDIPAKAFAALEAKRNPNSKYLVCASIQSVSQSNIGISYANEPGIIRDGVGEYHICMPPPLKLPDIKRIHDARMEGDPKKFIDLCKPGSTVGEVIDVEFREVPPIIDAEIEAIG